MDFSFDLLLNAFISGLLLGGFYAAVSVGIAISFGMLDVVNIAHPAFILLGSYVAYIGNTYFGLDPIVAAVIALPAFYLLGMAVYQIYYVAFESRDDQALRGLSFFFGRRKSFRCLSSGAARFIRARVTPLPERCTKVTVPSGATASTTPTWVSPSFSFPSRFRS